MNTALVILFMSVASSGEMPRLLEHNSTFNVQSSTFGGEVFWETHSSNGWKLQVNTISGWWRILDTNNIRVARGTTEEQLKALLNNRPTSVFSNYRDKGYRFSKTPAARTTGRTVVLIHGWGVRSSSMQDLADALAQEGFDACNYDYPTSECGINQHSEIFLEKLRELLGGLPDKEKLYVLTHSMGGLVLRSAMAKMTETECHRISAIVMLGPPNRGSVWANLGKLPLVCAFNSSLKDMTQNMDSFVSSIPAPRWLPPVGIIAGRYDGKVALDSTGLPEPLAYKRTVVNCTHPGLRKSSNVICQVLNFYATLSFTEND